MALSNKFISLLTFAIEEKIIDTHINKISMLNETDFFISKSKNCQEKIFVSLNNHEPFFTMCKEVKQFTSCTNNFIQKLKKELENGRIISLKKIDNDRIVCLSVTKTSETYKKLTRHLYLELIPNQANLILTDENKKILLCFRQFSLMPAGRLILPNATYINPVSQNNSEYSSFEKEQIEKYYQNCEIKHCLSIDNNVYSSIKTPTSTQIDLDVLYKNYYVNMENKHRKEINNDVVLSIARHSKSLKKKLQTLNNEMKNANKFINYKEYGDLILTYQDEINCHDGFVELDGNNIPYDNLLSPMQNATQYYHKYQKMKRSLIHLEEQISITKDKINYFEILENQLESSNDADLKGIEFELIGQGYINKKIVKNKNSKSNGMSQPYYITIDNVKIGYGKNNLQNNYLTFSLAKQTHYFLHVKDKPGSHVIIFDENPSNKVKEIAAMIALINSNLEDGEVQITQKKNVKKINSFGKVSLSTYESFYLRNVDGKLKESIRNLKKGL